MGVQGLWTLLSPSAHTTSLDAMRSKRLAVDISIWMHQLVRGINVADLPFDASDLFASDDQRAQRQSSFSIDDLDTQRLQKLYLMVRNSFFAFWFFKLLHIAIYYMSL